MAQFIQAKSGKETLNKCLKAINEIGKNEDWINNYNKKAKLLGFLPVMNVSLSDISLLDEISINWEYKVIYSQSASFEYRKYNGIKLIIQEDDRGLSRVVESYGIPREVIRNLEELDQDTLAEVIDLELQDEYIGDYTVDLIICEYKR